MDEIFREIFPKLVSIKEQPSFGLLVLYLCRAAIRFPDHQNSCLLAVQRVFDCNHSQLNKMKIIARVMFQQDHIPKPKHKQPPFNHSRTSQYKQRVGSLLLQQLWQFTNTELLCKNLLSLNDEELTNLCTNRYGAYMVNSFLVTTPTVSLEHKRTFCERIIRKGKIIKRGAGGKQLMANLDKLAAMVKEREDVLVEQQQKANVGRKGDFLPSAKLEMPIERLASMYGNDKVSPARQSGPGESGRQQTETIRYSPLSVYSPVSHLVPPWFEQAHSQPKPIAVLPAAHGAVSVSPPFGHQLNPPKPWQLPFQNQLQASFLQSGSSCYGPVSPAKGSHGQSRTFTVPASNLMTTTGYGAHFGQRAHPLFHAGPSSAAKPAQQLLKSVRPLPQIQCQQQPQCSYFPATLLDTPFNTHNNASTNTTSTATIVQPQSFQSGRSTVAQHSQPIGYPTGYHDYARNPHMIRQLVVDYSRPSTVTQLTQPTQPKLFPQMNTSVTDAQAAMAFSWQPSNTQVPGRDFVARPSSTGLSNPRSLRQPNARPQPANIRFDHRLTGRPHLPPRRWPTDSQKYR